MERLIASVYNDRVMTVIYCDVKGHRLGELGIFPLIFSHCKITIY